MNYFNKILIQPLTTVFTLFTTKLLHSLLQSWHPYTTIHCYVNDAGLRYIPLELLYSTTQIVMWLNQNFLLAEDLFVEDGKDLDVCFKSLHIDSGYLSIKMQPNGQVSKSNLQFKILYFKFFL